MIFGGGFVLGVRRAPALVVAGIRLYIGAGIWVDFYSGYTLGWPAAATSTTLIEQCPQLRGLEDTAQCGRSADTR